MPAAKRSLLSAIQKLHIFNLQVLIKIKNEGEYTGIFSRPENGHNLCYYLTYNFLYAGIYEAENMTRCPLFVSLKILYYELQTKQKIF